jgi:hypothetical protein
MTPKTNSASRLLQIVNQANSFPDNMTMMDAWSTLLNIKESDQLERVRKISAGILTISSEVDFLKFAMQGTPIPESVYANAITGMHSAFSLLLVTAHWNSAKLHLGSDLKVSLDYCQHILSDEETLISDADLNDIRQKINELKECLTDSTLPDRLRKLIEHQIGLIEAALFEYPVAGVKALRKAQESAMGEIITEYDEVSKSKDLPAVSR